MRLPQQEHQQDRADAKGGRDEANVECRQTVVFGKGFPAEEPGYPRNNRREK